MEKYALYIILILFLICVYCNSLSPIFALFFSILFMFSCEPIKTNKKEGGMETANNPVNKYKKFRGMLDKQLRYVNGFNKKKNRNNSFYYKLYEIYKYKPGFKRWGNVIRPVLDKKFNRTIMNILDKMNESSSVMDYGCGDGYTLKYFEDKVKDIICVDIDDYRSHMKNSQFIKNSHISSIDTIDNNSIDLLIALQSLHHIEFEDDKTDFYDRITPIIQSIVNKIKPGGYLLIREHDVKNTKDLYPVLFEHLLYDLMELKDKSMSIEEVKKWVQSYHIKHKGWYFSKQFLQGVLEDAGMELVETEYKRGENPSNIYNSIFVKKM